MLPAIACLNATALLATAGAAIAAVVVGSFGLKALLARYEHPRPSLWRMAFLTALEPFLYVAAIGGVPALARFAWGWSPDLALPVLGAAVAFVCSAGLHGALLARSAPVLGETRKALLALAYSLPVPLATMGGVALLAIL